MPDDGIAAAVRVIEAAGTLRFCARELGEGAGQRGGGQARDEIGEAAQSHRFASRHLAAEGDPVR